MMTEKLIASGGIILAVIFLYAITRLFIKGVITFFKFIFYGFILLSAAAAGAVFWFFYLR